ICMFTSDAWNSRGLTLVSRSSPLSSGTRRGKCRQNELHNRPARWVGAGPQAAAVGIDDRAADRQPHAHAGGLGGVERSEQQVGMVFGESWPPVAHRHAHTARLALGADEQVALTSTEC